MEEINDDPFQINRDIQESVIAGRFYINKKRKFQDEISSLPLQKHLCAIKSDFPSENLPPTNSSSKKSMNKSEDDDEGRVSQIESRGSGKGSNFVSEDDNSAMSVSSDWPSTLSVNLSGCSSSTSFPAVSSTSESRSTEIGGQLRYYHNYDDQHLEYRKYVDYDSSEYDYDDIEVYKGKEIEDLVHSDDEDEKNFILTSGRWNVNQESQQETKKLTIDKEFEQYFSTLML